MMSVLFHCNLCCCIRTLGYPFALLFDFNRYIFINVSRSGLRKHMLFRNAMKDQWVSPDSREKSLSRACGLTKTMAATMTRRVESLPRPKRLWEDCKGESVEKEE